ncbi:hypothetical protein U8607_05670 [Methylobacterium durans]|uniref:hypothetical protein n=1 Tax=Methylobacterium durans TaxID=2202825 RepID=UPI002AFE1CC3|nr:hypothetical protein [Methylobacterium durans]MEA1831568.1 hypothetical protein [Methylobacterium durans]
MIRFDLTHFHADHCLGAKAFPADAISAGPGLKADLRRFGNELAAGMYRVEGDWMRGTGARGPRRRGGDRRASLPSVAPVGPHLRGPLNVRGEIRPAVFRRSRLPRPCRDDPGRESSALATLAGIGHGRLVPEHGHVESGRRGIDQTLAWLDMVEGRISLAFEEGVDITEAIGLPLPDWAERNAVTRYANARSVMHLLPRIEAERLPLLAP